MLCSRALDNDRGTGKDMDGHAPKWVCCWHEVEIEVNVAQWPQLFRALGSLPLRDR